MRPALPAVLVLAALLLAGCGGSSNATVADGDGDGLSNDEEAAGWELHVVTAHGNRTGHVASDPARADSDGDGLVDRYEFFFALDPGAADTDLDGLTDCQEKQHTVRAQCEDPDFGGPTDRGTRTDAALWDTDGDGLGDGQEIGGFDVAIPGGMTRRVTTDPMVWDTDADALSDGAEHLRFASDPRVRDTDGDGCMDGLDPVPSRRESFSLRLGRLEAQQGGTLRFKATLGGEALEPAPEATVAAGASEQDAVAFPSVHPGACSVSPLQPWISVALIVERVGPDGQGAIADFHSLNPNGSVQAYWNAASGDWSWTFGGDAALPAPMAWSGADGSLVFTPLLLPAQAT